MEDTRIEYIISSILHDIGILPHLKGYRYLREAIIIALHDIDSLNSMYKIIYNSLALKYNCEIHNIEKAIRNVIKARWPTLDKEKIHKYGLKSDRIPTNSEFIGTVAKYIIHSFSIPFAP